MITKSNEVKIPVQHNVNYKLIGADGKAKRLFAMNSLGNALLSAIREKVSEPIGADGKVKAGLKNRLAAYGLRIPFITGYWTTSLNVANGIPNTGKAAIASRINGSGAEAAATYIAVGTGVGAFSASDTTLGTETAASGLSRANGTASRVTTSVTNDTAQVTYTFTVTGTVAVTEAGLLNASSGGSLFARQTFSAINVVNGDSLQITWKLSN